MQNPLGQYLRIGGRIACFNVDRDFSDVVDALVVVDLVSTQRKLLERYMGRDGAEQFFAFHQTVSPRAKASRPMAAAPR